MTPDPIYLDYHATTPVDPRVLEAMLPCFTTKFGNAASRNHPYGWAAKDAVETARANVAKLIGAAANEVVFTSGATESNNLALRGVVEANRQRGSHAVTCVTEHRSVLDTCKSLEARGIEVRYLPVSGDGRISLDDLRAAIRPDTILVSVMSANNEIGVVQPIAEIGRISKERQVLFHTDAVQAVGKIPFDVQRLNADLVSISAHKIYGPKGIGALYVRRRNPTVSLVEQISGGSHERGLRSGTLNVPGIVGMGVAAAVCRDEMAVEAARLQSLRDRLQTLLVDGLDDVIVNGSREHRLPHSLNVSFGHVEGESLLMAMNDIAVSSGAACTSASREPSYVLKAIGLSDDLARASIRFGLGRWTTETDVNYAAQYVIDVVNRLREMHPAGTKMETKPLALPGGLN